MKRILLVLMSVLVVTLGLSVVPANAQAAVTLSPGARWTPGDAPIPGFLDWCGIGGVGFDDAGAKVAITAAHCVSNLPDGATVFAYEPRVPIGTIRYRNNDLDYAVFSLNSDVALSSNGVIRVDGVGAPPAPFTQTCKGGGTTGLTCGVVLSVNPTRIYSTTFALWGDSGSAYAQGTKLVGIVRAITFQGFEYVNLDAVLKDMAAHGDTFTHVSN